MEKLKQGDTVRLKRSILAKSYYLDHIGTIRANPSVSALVGTVYVKWADNVGEWLLASWLERV